MGRTRVAHRMDVQRLGAALKSPGIDTRCWVSLAVATEDGSVDPDGLGAFVDVQLMPTEEPTTARFGPVYAGEGFGLYTRIRKDDELVVLIPSGETSEGPVVVSRLWSPADKMPQAAIDNPEDFVLVVEEGKNLRFKLTGGGEVRFDVGDGANQVIIKEDLVELGAEGAGDKASLDSKVQDALTTAKNNAQAAVDYATQIKGVWASGVPVPQDGGAAVQTAQIAASTAIIAPVLTSPSATNSERVTIDK